MSSIPLNLIRIRSAWWTLLAISLEATFWLAIGNSALIFFTTPDFTEMKEAMLPWIGVFIVADVALTFVERQIGRRSLVEEGSHRTLPISWIPGGRVGRLALMLALCAPVLLVKLVAYFLWLTVLIPAAWVSGHTMGKGIDLFDKFWSPVEFAVNWVFNALHYCKINPRSSAFSSFFNLSLSMWCLNH